MSSKVFEDSRIVATASNETLTFKSSYRISSLRGQKGQGFFVRSLDRDNCDTQSSNGSRHHLEDKD